MAKYKKEPEGLDKIPSNVLEHGFYRVDGVKFVWPWKKTDGAQPDTFPTVDLGEIAEEIVVDEPYNIDSEATFVTKAGLKMKTPPLRELFEKEGVDFTVFGVRWQIDGCTEIISASAKRKAMQKARAALSPKRRRRTTGSRVCSASPKQVANVSAALARRLERPGPASSSSKPPTAEDVLG